MSQHKIIIATLTALCTTCSMTSLAMSDVYNFRTVAITGEAAPGSFGGTFTGFGVPSINSDGLVAFAAQTNAPTVTSGMWLTPANAPSTVTFVAGKGWPVPGAPGGVTFGDFSMAANRAPLINNPGNVGFQAPLVGIEANQVNGLFRRIDGTVSKVAIPGDAAPGIGAGVVFAVLDQPAFNNSNLMAFLAVLDGPGVTSDNDVAQYMHWFGGLNLVQREGWTAPGLPGTTFGQIFSWRSQINDAGRVLFQCTLNHGGSSTSSHWTGWPGALTLLARSGDSAPLGMTWGASQTGSGGSLSESGTCFARQVHDGTATRSGLWYNNGQWTHAVAYAYGPGPIGSYQSVLAESAMSNGGGTIAFRARLNQPADSDSVIIRKASNTPPAIVAREGDQVYGWGGVLFDDLGGTEKVIIDDTGRVYIIATLKGPGVNNSNNIGMWVREPDGQWHLVARTGLSITLDDGIFRTVESFDVLRGYGLHTGYRPGVNNNGDIAMRMTFTDGASAIVVAELPGCLGDFNGNGFVDGGDLLILLSAWGNCDGCDADLNSDGQVDGQDMLILLANWGVCP